VASTTVARRNGRWFRIILACACISLGAPSARLTAGESAPSAATAERAKPKTERDYLLEELKLAEEQLSMEQKRLALSQGSPDKVLQARRSVLSLERQISAHDARTKRLSPEQEEKRQQARDEQKRKADETQKRSAALKQELLPRLLEIARNDPDTKVRLTAIYSINGLQMDQAIEPLGKIALRDTDIEVRQTALKVIAGFHNEASFEALFKLFDEFSDVNLKTMALMNWSINETVYSPYTQIVAAVPQKAIPKLKTVASEGADRGLRLRALEKLNAISGDEATLALLEVYEHCVDHEIKQVIVRYLGGRADASAMRQLLAIAKSDADARTRQVAVEMLGQMPLGPNAGRLSYPPGAVMVPPPTPLPPPPPPVPMPNR